MNEITIHGNLTAEPVLRRGQNGHVFVTFDVAVNRSYYDRGRDTRVELPAVFFPVIANNGLAENAAASLRRGTTVTVTGYLTDNSFTAEGSGQRVRRQRLEAGDIAVSLRFATAQVTKRAPTRRGEEPAGDQQDQQEPAA